jgi:hypothetical protein
MITLGATRIQLVKWVAQAGATHILHKSERRQMMLANYPVTVILTAVDLERARKFY